MVTDLKYGVSSPSFEINRETSRIVTENLIVYYDLTLLVNYVTLGYLPSGIISVLITKDLEDFELKGEANILGKRVEFLKDEDFNGTYAEVKYLTNS